MRRQIHVRGRNIKEAGELIRISKGERFNSDRKQSFIDNGLTGRQYENFKRI